MLTVVERRSIILIVGITHVGWCIYVYICAVVIEKSRQQDEKEKQIEIAFLWGSYSTCKLDTKTGTVCMKDVRDAITFSSTPLCSLFFWCMFLQITEYFAVLVTSSHTQ